AEPEDTIWYTVNGSLPGRDDLQYTGPLHISESRVIRAIILGAGRMNRKPVTQSYLFRDQAPTLTTISLATDSLNFFDQDSGIYVMGPNASADDPNYGANFWMDWERPIHIELFEPDGSKGMDADAGVSIFGGWSRANPQKSLAFYSRGKYGDKSFRYKLFPDLPLEEYNNFILRNSGNDWNWTMIRDALLTSLLDQTNIDRQAYRPASVYLNGQYWGLLNIREKINEHFIAAHYNISRYQIDLLEGNANPVNGDADHYNQMLNFLYDNSPASNTHYDQVKTMMDVENFMDYQLAQIYFNNTDWPGNNIKYWRPKTPDGRWKWIIYDTDFGFGIWDAEQYHYTYNTLAFALAANSTSYANAPWATFLLRRLLENQEFKNEFINRFADRMNTVFSYTHVLQRLNSMSGVIQNEMPYHYTRWNRWGEDIQFWNYQLEKMRNFALERVPYMRLYISEQFGNIGYAALTVTTSTAQSGRVELNTLRLERFPWTGTYFKTVPVKLTAKPKTGYRFVTWEGPVDNPLSATTLLTLTGNTTVRAVFEPDGSNLNDMVINEIYYDDPSDFDADDWVELYNKGNVTINLSGWILKDEEDDHRFVIPQGTRISPGAYLVLCRNTVKFTQSYPGLEPLGEFDFGLGSDGDCVRLFSADSILVDSVRYGVAPPWPSAPNDYGTSIELLNADYDNAIAINWTESLYAHGTPGATNSLSTGTDENNTDAPASREMLLKAYPNPFSYFTTIQYEVPERQMIHISITDIRGNQVAGLYQGEVDAGIREVVWDGFGSNGKRLPPGIYIFTLQTKYYKKYLRLVIL
ncbi:MAG: CotH kinase family protein, partial [Bacteroidales bacterium]